MSPKNLDALAAQFDVFTPGRRGHGRTPGLDGQITDESMAEARIGRHLEADPRRPEFLRALPVIYRDDDLAYALITLTSFGCSI